MKGARAGQIVVLRERLETEVLLDGDRDRRERAADNRLRDEALANVSLDGPKALRRGHPLKLRVDLLKLGIELFPQTRPGIVPEERFEIAWANLSGIGRKPVPVGALNGCDANSKLRSVQHGCLPRLCLTQRTPARATLAGVSFYLTSRCHVKENSYGESA